MRGEFKGELSDIKIETVGTAGAAD